jgi:hypothetical protein
MIKFYVYEKLKNIYLHSKPKSCKISDEAVSYIISYKFKDKTELAFILYSLSYYFDNIHNSSLDLKQHFFCEYRTDLNNHIVNCIYPVSLKLLISYGYKRLLDYLFVFSISRVYPDIKPTTVEDLFGEMKIFAGGA